MDVSFVQVALIFVVTFIAAIDQFDFLESLYQPIVTGAVVGAILGDVQTGLVVGEVTQRASDEPYGTVIDQSISAETKVDAGTTINFVISEGPAMPDYGDDATTSGGEPQP